MINGFVEEFRSRVRGRTFTRDEANEMIDFINLCAPPAPKTAPQRVFVVTYDESAGITDADKVAAEAFLGAVVWFKTTSGSRPPQIIAVDKEQK